MLIIDEVYTVIMMSVLWIGVISAIWFLLFLPYIYSRLYKIMNIYLQPCLARN